MLSERTIKSSFVIMQYPFFIAALVTWLAILMCCFTKSSFYSPCWSAQWPVQCSGQYQWQTHFCPRSWCQSLPSNRQKVSPVMSKFTSNNKYNNTHLCKCTWYMMEDGGGSMHGCWSGRGSSSSRSTLDSASSRVTWVVMATQVHSQNNPIWNKHRQWASKHSDKDNSTPRLSETVYETLAFENRKSHDLEEILKSFTWLIIVLLKHIDLLKQLLLIRASNCVNKSN